jgi:purine-nucleoside phosphorylase
VTDFERVNEAAEAIGARTSLRPGIAVILGSGLGAVADSVDEPTTIHYHDIPHWPAVTVEGHDGRLVVGRFGGRSIAALAGRTHAYEGHDLRTVTFGVRVLGCLGVRVLIMTNAVGAIDSGLTIGDLVVVDDHLNLSQMNPLTGPNDERFGPRFPDMTEVYSKRLRGIADEAAMAARIPIRHGVYAFVTGPSYETPAEIKYLRTIGADAVGMSSVPEAIVARHMGIEVLAISYVSNIAAGLSRQRPDHRDVIAAGERVEPALAMLLKGIVARL